MRYQQPYGITDQNASYINGNPAAGIQGSIPPAAAFEEPMRELVNMISLSGLTPTDSDLQQLAKAIQTGKVNYGVDTGTQNAMIVVLSPPVVGGYPPGMVIRVKVLHSNISDATHTTLTLDAGAGAGNVVRSDGSLPASNDLPAGAVANLVWDGTRWQIVNFLGVGGTGGGSTTYIVQIPYAVDTGGTNAINVTFAPALTDPLNVGQAMLVKIKNTVLGPTTIKINATTIKSVVRNDGAASPLQIADLQANAVVLFVWDGSNVIMLNGGNPFGVPSKIVWFTTIGTTNWTVLNGVYRLRARVWGAGGGGGGSAHGRIAGGGGGGGGGYSERICQVAPGTVIPVTIAAGRAGQSWGTGMGPQADTTSFGGFCQASGGLCGADDSYTFGPIGGGPGSGSGGDINLNGEYGWAPMAGNYNDTDDVGGPGGQCGGGGGSGGGGSNGGPADTAQIPGGGGEGAPLAYVGAGMPGKQGMVSVEF